MVERNKTSADKKVIKLLKWLRDTPHHFGGWNDDWSKFTIRGDARSITVDAATVEASWPFKRTCVYAEERRMYMPNDAGMNLLQEAGL